MYPARDETAGGVRTEQTLVIRLAGAPFAFVQPASVIFHAIPASDRIGNTSALERPSAASLPPISKAPSTFKTRTVRVGRYFRVSGLTGWRRSSLIWRDNDEIRIIWVGIGKCVEGRTLRAVLFRIHRRWLIARCDRHSTFRASGAASPKVVTAISAEPDGVRVPALRNTGDSTNSSDDC